MKISKTAIIGLRKWNCNNDLIFVYRNDMNAFIVHNIVYFI